MNKYLEVILLAYKNLGRSVILLFKAVIELIWLIIARPFYKSKKDVPWVFKKDKDKILNYKM